MIITTTTTTTTSVVLFGSKEDTATFRAILMADVTGGAGYVYFSRTPDMNTVTVIHES